MIQEAAFELKDNTEFFSDYMPLGEEIPLVKTSVNRLIAGEDRTLADLFDLSEWACNLTGTEIMSAVPSSAPSSIPSEPPSPFPTRAPTNVSTIVAG